MEHIKTVGDLRKLLEKFEDDWNIELSLVEEITGESSYLSPFSYENVKIENTIVDVGYSDRVICLHCKKGE